MHFDDLDEYFALRYPVIENDVFGRPLEEGDAMEYIPDREIVRKIEAQCLDMFKHTIKFDGVVVEIYARTEQRLQQKVIDFYERRRKGKVP